MHAWAGSLRRVTEVGSIVIIKAHRERNVPFATLLPDFAIVREADAELPGIVERHTDCFGARRPTPRAIDRPPGSSPGE